MLVLSSIAGGEELTETDRMVLLEKLEELEEGVTVRMQQRAGSAYGVFKEAAKSEGTALELFLKCAEKVHFLDEKRDGQSFRDWRRWFDERRGKSKAFQRLLQHRLNWLVLSLDAERNDEKDSLAVGRRVIEAFEKLIEEGDLWKEKVRKLNRSGDEVVLRELLKEDVFESVFAKAYDVKQTEGWPGSLIEFGTAYEVAVLLQYREVEKLEEFRRAWGKRIEQEGRFLEVTGNEPDGGGKTAAFEKFYLITRPQLMWELEREVFGIGGQREAAKKMVEHLEEFEGHVNEAKWLQEFMELVAKGKKVSGD